MMSDWIDRLDRDGIYVGRYWNDTVDGPSIVRVAGGVCIDITAPDCCLTADILERDDPAGFVATREGQEIEPRTLLAPCDLQSIKACGVTFVASMLERVVEEKAGGDPSRASAFRDSMGEIVGGQLDQIVPGSDQAAEVKAFLISEGLWSQYLEVGIGPDAEVFTKCPPMAAVGHNAEIGIHRKSEWNNPEPELVLAVNSRGKVVGATLGNDVNLRDIEGRSALLLGKAKDNNASAAIGPLIRLIDETYNLDAIRNTEITLTVEGPDGFVLNGSSSVARISRDPLDLVAQTIGANHQYPDGLMLYLGTMFAPTEDRDEPGIGFTHKPGDVVSVSAPGLGTLQNTVQYSDACPPWTFGIRHLIENLCRRNLLECS